ncbi:MAG: type I-G CRISPR-associated protein Csb2 [Longimicrobiales bacterium]
MLPLFTRCLPQAELLHQSLVSLLGNDAPRSPVLSGRDPTTGRPLSGHRHTHYLPLDLDNDGRLDHVIVHAPMGLDPLAQGAIRRIQRTWTKGDEGSIIVTQSGFGDLQTIAEQLRRLAGVPLATLGAARSWASVTPFVPPRHLKRRRHTLEDQVRSELKSRGLPVALTVALLDREELVRRRLLQFVRSRRVGKPQPPSPRAFGIRLVFDRPVAGPITLGYASHYGLGLFAREA